jgi:hypothetical protein
MVRIKMQYDKYNRTFKLVDREFGSVLEDGAQYELLVPLMLEGISEEEEACVLVNIDPLEANLPVTLPC